jgi:hypothetical protein
MVKRNCPVSPGRPIRLLGLIGGCLVVEGCDRAKIARHLSGERREWVAAKLRTSLTNH